MTGQGAAIVRRAWDAINRSKSADEVMAEIRELVHAEIEFVNPADALEQGTRRGAEGLRLALVSYLAGRIEWHWDTEEALAKFEREADH